MTISTLIPTFEQLILISLRVSIVLPFIFRPNVQIRRNHHRLTPYTDILLLPKPLPGHNQRTNKNINNNFAIHYISPQLPRSTCGSQTPETRCRQRCRNCQLLRQDTYSGIPCHQSLSHLSHARTGRFRWCHLGKLCHYAFPLCQQYRRG